MLLFCFLGIWLFWEFEYDILGPPIDYLQDPAPKITDVNGNERPLIPGEAFNAHFWYKLRDPHCPRYYSRWLLHEKSGAIIDLESHHGHATKKGPGYVVFQFELPKFVEPGEWRYQYKVTWQCNPIRAWPWKGSVPFQVAPAIVRLDPFTGTEGKQLEGRIKKLEEMEMTEPWHEEETHHGK